MEHVLNATAENLAGLGQQFAVALARRQGAQGALLVRRLEFAAARGAGLAMVVTAPGTIATSSNPYACWRVFGCTAVEAITSAAPALLDQRVLRHRPDKPAAEADTIEKLTYDLYYIKHMSPVMDLRIFWKSIWTVLTGAGAR